MNKMEITATTYRGCNKEKESEINISTEKNHNLIKDIRKTRTTNGSDLGDNGVGVATRTRLKTSGVKTKTHKSNHQTKCTTCIYNKGINGITIQVIDT